MNTHNLRTVTTRLIAILFLLASSSLAKAEGGAGPEAITMGNMCMVMFDYDMIHITAYLPGQSRPSADAITGQLRKSLE